MRTKERSAAILGLGLALGFAAPAWGQDVEAADKLYREGIERLGAGDYTAACPLLKQSLEADKAAGTVFALADCHAFAGRTATGVRYYEDYLKMVEEMPPAKRARQEQLGRVKMARKQLEQLQPDIPRVLFTVSAQTPAGTRVECDGAEMELASMTAERSIDPGEHIVRVIVPGKTPVETHFTVAVRETKTVELLFPVEEPIAKEPVKSAPVVQSKPKVAMKPEELRQKEDNAGANWMNIGKFVAGGVGVVGLGLGAGFGYTVLNESETLLNICPRDGKTGRMTCENEEERSRVKDWQTRGIVSTVGFGVGIAGALGALVLWKLEPIEENKLKLNIYGLGPHGAFVGMGGIW